MPATGWPLSPTPPRAARCVVVAQRAAQCPLPLIVVDDVRRALALAAARFFPRQPSTIAAVTGTSGKTSVVAFLRQIWAALGHEAASLGTVGIVDSRGAHYGALTTPGPVELHQTLDELAGRGVTHLAMEASSLGDRSAPARRDARRRRRLHQFFARPSRSSRRHGRLFRREDAALRYADAPGPDGGDRRRQRRRAARDGQFAARAGCTIFERRRRRARRLRCLRRRRIRARHIFAPAAMAASNMRSNCRSPALSRSPTRSSPPASPSQRRRPLLASSRRSKRSRARRDGSNSSGSTMARRSSSTTPISPTRSKRCSRPCGR